MNQRDLCLSGLSGNLLGRDLPLLEPTVDPRDEEEVPGARMDYAGARQEKIREGIADNADPKLIDGVALPKELDYLECAAAIVFGEVEPGEG